MPGACPARRAPVAPAGPILALLVLLLAPRAGAIEALDGRIQLHGFGEIQMRALSRDLNEDVDLAQWYNVLNLELEVDVAPDGFGPTDLIEAYVRVEARYDCVWTRGCGMMRSATTYGDRTEKVPPRFRDAEEEDYSGVIPPTPPGTYDYRARERTTEPRLRIGDNRLANLQPTFVSRYGIVTGTPVTDLTGQGVINLMEPIPNEGISGFDTLFNQRGADNVANTADDPGIYTFDSVINSGGAPYSFALVKFKGAPGSSSTQVIGPWRPKNVIQANALMVDRANPFRGGFAASTGTYRAADPLDENLEALKASLFASPLPGALGTVSSLTVLTPGDATGDSFAGDWSGIVPCRDPGSLEAGAQRSGIESTPNCVPNPVVLSGAGFPPQSANYEFANVRVAFVDQYQYVNTTGGPPFPPGQVFSFPNPGGLGELPLRPAPDLSNLSPKSANPDRLLAQGLYIPSPGLQRELAAGDLDGLGFNYTQAERSWNRGQSQDQTKELKEAYLDIEWLESRLWTRVGKQSIVWGKTELFRTTDQFNPQDLALASLPSLEESRISLWAFRAVYSLYTVGPLEDVRVELATNFDEYQPADLGAAGEPFTPDVVGTLTNGIFFHSFTGVGVAGIDRPDNPWDNIKGLEVGGRVEFRAGPFSFAITDFYGYNDFPHVDRIWTYSKTNDLISNRPLVGGSVAGAAASLCDSPVLDRDGDGVIDSYPDPANGTTRSIIDSKNPWSYSPRGLGGQPGCLKGGGAAGFENADPLFGGAGNALQNHHANQQIFAWICNLTVGIAASLDPGTCAWNIFDSPTPLGGAVLTVPFVEMVSAMTSGDRDSRLRSLVDAIIANTKEDLVNRVIAMPYSPLNGDPGPSDPDCPTDPGDYNPFVECALWDGLISITTRDLNRVNPAVPVHTLTFRGVEYTTSCRVGISGSTGGVTVTSNSGPVFVEQLRAQFPVLYDRLTRPGICAQFLFHNDAGDILSLDSTLTNFQKSLLGCGAFYGTRCDAGALVETLPDGIVIDGATDEEAIANLEAAIVTLQPRGGGIDFVNTEASALVQAWPGIEGTAPLGAEVGQDTYWTTFGPSKQPGTAAVEDPLAFENGGHEVRDFGPTCTRPDGEGGLVTLPGCRGIETIFLERDAATNAVTAIEIAFEDGYRPSVDGCVIGGGANRDAPGAIGNIGGVDVIMRANASGYAPDAAELEECHTTSFSKNGNFVAESVRRVGSSWLWHPTAGCLSEARARDVRRFGSNNINSETGALFPDCGRIQNAAGGGVDRQMRDRFGDLNANGFPDIEDEFVNTLTRLDDVPVTMAQVFKSEMAAFSFNFLTFLVITSCSQANEGVENIEQKQECFNPGNPLLANKCSFNAPHLCSNVKGFLAVAGVTRNDVRAGGSDRYGRRTFIWHSGGEIVLRYEKRNVLGFSGDFAEDFTKSNWGVEFTWIEGLPYADANQFDNLSKADALNLTVSVDRPTFINFLNANRTFFINSQWFFQYVPGYRDSFPSNGPWNVLFTFAVFTGYFQDRLQPSFISVFDVQSVSGGFLPNVSYRFTEAFSATIGVNMFFGHTERTKMSINEIAPVSNRAPAGDDEALAYKDGVDNILGLVRKRDEFYLRLRWTF